MPTLLITWWTSGLWKAIVEKFVSHWRHAVVLARDSKKWDALHVQLWANNITYYPCDIRDKNNLTTIFDNIKHIDWLINNSGIWYWENAFEESLEHIEDTIQTNLVGAMRCTKLALQSMIPQKSGVIINIWSTQSVRFRVWASAYAASKAWLKMYTEALREEVKDFGINVLGIYPWAIKTPMRDKEEMEKHKGTMMDPSSVANIIFDAYNSTLTDATQEDIFIRPTNRNS